MDPVIFNNQNIALGFGMLLMQNRSAKEHFDSLNDDEKREFIERTRSFNSEDEFNMFFDSITNNAI